MIDRESYRLGPGDGLLLSLWGEVDDAYELVVTPEGRLLVPSVGPIDVAGIALADAERLVVEVSGETYSGSRITLDLIKLRTFRVHLTGSVEIPGAYPATPADRVSDVLERATGPKGNASLRNIRVTHRDGTTEVVDLVRYTLAGDLDSNIPVDIGDVINLQARQDSLAIVGAVVNPGYVEFRPGDTVRDLVALAGGLTSRALLSRAQLTSFPGGGEAPRTRTIDLTAALRGQSQASELSAGDFLVIPSESLPWGGATVSGEVRYPGEFAVIRGENANIQPPDAGGRPP